MKIAKKLITIMRVINKVVYWATLLNQFHQKKLMKYGKKANGNEEYTEHIYCS